ncbi:conserved hypothetical protein [Haloferula helveola]|uniref:Tetratricopeptide repeat protein n=1 Tax=Haloferula helveola TaxID=490095 RepID=A0ABN6H9Y0_9BACT|nr:conserved hypothetical protein [Haloferula helveola]
MTADEIASSAAQDATYPTGLTDTEKVLWLAKAGRWDEAHDLCQELPNPAGSWIHAWLHRQEGDYGNACYWYARANKPAPASGAPLEDEWFQIARELAR